MTTLGPYTVHPHADQYPLLEGEEFAAFVEDIREQGLQQPIVLTADKSTIVDGRNRYRACVEAQLDPVFDTLPEFYTEEHVVSYIESANLHRRHLTREQVRELVAARVKAFPEKSDRQHAKEAKVSPTTVGSVRKEMEDSGDVSKLDTRTDAKGRQQPAAKPKSKPRKAKAQPTAPKPRETLPKLTRAARGAVEAIRGVTISDGRALLEAVTDLDNTDATREAIEALIWLASEAQEAAQALQDALNQAGQAAEKATEESQKRLQPGDVVSVKDVRARRFKVTGFDEKGNVETLEVQKGGEVAGFHAFAAERCKVDRKATADLAAREANR